MALFRYQLLSSATSFFLTCLRTLVHGISSPKRKLSRSNECSLKVGRAESRILAPNSRRYVESICIQQGFMTDCADLHLMAHLRAHPPIHHLQQRRICSCTGICAISQEEQGTKVRSLADQRLSYSDIRCGCSDDIDLCMVLGHFPARQTLATDALWCGHEYYHLRVARILGYPRSLAVGLLHPRRVRIRALWSLLRLGP